MGHEFAFHRSRTMKLSLGVTVGLHAYEVFSRTERKFNAHGLLSVPVDYSLHTTAGDPELTRVRVTMTVMKTSFMLEYLHHCTPALIVFSVSGKTSFGILSLATTRIVL